MKVKQSLLIIILIITSLAGFSQKNDSIKIMHHFSGMATFTNNGISLIPSFSLGKPAALLLMSFGGRRVSFDNDIRFALDGKPWNFLFWARYKLFTQGRFRMNTGANLSLNFRTASYQFNGASFENIIVRRYVAAELAPNYFVAKNISVGSYYLYSRGVDQGTVKNTHFITVNASFSRISISNKIYLRVNPQAYYLFQDGKEGYYFNTFFSLSKTNFPLSLSSIINKAIRSRIPGSKDFVWNVSLLYSLNHN